MSDLIDRQAAIDALCDNCDNVQAVCPHYPCKQYTAIDALSSAQAEIADDAEFWRERADYYSDLCMRLIAEMGKGVKIGSVKISESGIEFIKEQPPAQPERTEERTETYACDLIRRQDIKWHDYLVADGNGMYHNEKVAYKSQIDDLPSAQPEQWWIPVGERLPEDDVEVLVTDDSGGVQWLGIDKMLSYEDGSGRFWLTSQNPTAWMPLPEPYGGEQE